MDLYGKSTIVGVPSSISKPVKVKYNDAGNVTDYCICAFQWSYALLHSGFVCILMTWKTGNPHFCCIFGRAVLGCDHSRPMTMGAMLVIAFGFSEWHKRCITTLNEGRCTRRRSRRRRKGSKMSPAANCHKRRWRWSRWGRRWLPSP